MLARYSVNPGSHELIHTPAGALHCTTPCDSIKKNIPLSVSLESKIPNPAEKRRKKRRMAILKETFHTSTGRPLALRLRLSFFVLAAPTRTFLITVRLGFKVRGTEYGMDLEA
jgi:hypothetical protein